VIVAELPLTVQFILAWIIAWGTFSKLVVLFNKMTIIIIHCLPRFLCWIWQFKFAFGFSKTVVPNYVDTLM
jgi:hypothetical protein